ncbi:MAG: UvrD-helicase domain-containing protein, partial [Patescibacteria group bacterium]
MTQNLLENLNQEQLEAVTHQDGPLMIIAGAGTGKTTVVTQRIAWLIEQGLAKPDEILALTFTEKAATEMEERVDRLLPIGYIDLWISTFHSFCERILHEHALEIGLPHEFKLFNEVDTLLLMRRNFERFDLDYYRPRANPTRFLKALLQHFSRVKDEMITPAAYLDYVESRQTNADTAQGVASEENAEELSEIVRLKEIANAYHLYQQILLENNAFD